MFDAESANTLVGDYDKKTGQSLKSLKTLRIIDYNNDNSNSMQFYNN